MMAGRSPLAVTYTALAFGTVLAPYYFLSALMHLEMPLRVYVLCALLACSLSLLVRFAGWAKLDSWRAKQSAGVRIAIQAATAFAVVCSLLILLSLSAFGGMSGELMWVYLLEALALGTILALLPVLLLRPSAFERAFSLRLSPKLNVARLAAYGFLILLIAFACVEVVKFYRFTHPVY